MMTAFILIALTCICLIIVLVTDYYKNTERLTGRWFRRRKVGFVNYDIIVEVKVGNKTLTKIADKKDLKVLRKRFNITNFKALEN